MTALRRSRRPAVACTAWLLAGKLALAASTAPPVDLVWIAPRQCPDHDAVIRDISNILGNPSADRGVGKPLSVRGEVWRGDDRRWHVTLTSQGTRTEPRALAADSCEAVADAAALIVALLVDPSRARPQGSAPPPANTVAPSTSPVDAVSPPASGTRAVRENTPRSSDVTTPPSADVPSRSTTPPSADVPSGAQAPAFAAGSAPGASVEAGRLAAPAPADRGIGSQPATRRWTAGVSGGGSVGALPSVQPDAELAIAWTNERIRLEVAGRSDWSHQHVPLASRTGEGADFRLLSGLARGCYSLVSLRLSLGGCAAFEVDWLRASGFGALTTVTGDTAIPALGASALATYAIGDRIGIRFLLEGVAPLSRPSFVIVAPGAVALVDQPAPIWGRAMLGAEFRFF